MRSSWMQFRGGGALQRRVHLGACSAALCVVAACQTKAQVISRRLPPTPSATMTEGTSAPETVTSSADTGGSTHVESTSAEPTTDVVATTTFVPIADAGISDDTNVSTLDASPAPDAGETSDAPVDMSCEARCAAAGGVCVASGNPADDKCVFECGDNTCLEPITCPSGLHCEITCGVGACGGLLTCATERNCMVTCDGSNSCFGGIDCARSLNCGVDCVGDNSCQGQIRGGAKNSNNVNCNGAGACAGGIDCDSDNCTANCNGSESCSGLITANAMSSTVNCSNGSCTDVRCEANNCSANCSGASCDNVTCSATNCNINCDDQSCAVVNCSSPTCR